MAGSRAMKTGGAKRRVAASTKKAASAGTVVASPKDPNDKLVVNLIDNEVWLHMVRKGVHEFSRRFYDDSANAGMIYGQDMTLRALVEPSIRHALKQKLTGDELLDFVSGSIETIDTHKSGTIYLTRKVIDGELANIIKHLQKTTKRYTFRWSTRTALIALIFDYATFLVKNDYKDIALIS
jgi:hypothetical protein